MERVTTTFNGVTYELVYNPYSGYYELDIEAPTTGGVYRADITYEDLLGDDYNAVKDIQVLIRPVEEIKLNKDFIWIFSWRDFGVKDIVELSDYEINIDEETNATSTFKILNNTGAEAGDLICVKKDGDPIYWGILTEVSNNAGERLYTFISKYITNLFDRDIVLNNEALIRTTGIEDQLAGAIEDNFINSDDTLLNLDYLEINVESHTTKQTSVSNVENNIYNLHTWLTNCTQNYDILYSFEIVDSKLVMTIRLEDRDKELIDINAMNISKYEEVFETEIVAKVVVITSSNPYTLYLLNDRTTTTDKTNPNRARGKVETIYTEDIADARQAALDVFKGNRYNHNITFTILDRFIDIGTPIAIKTKKSLIYDTYISSIKYTKARAIEYQCGNIRINFIDKLLKERSK